MPEGDTIVWTATRLNRVMTDVRVAASDIRVPRCATTSLRGYTSLGVGTYGKHLFHRFSSGVTLHTHLKMEGRWSILDMTGSGRARPSSQISRLTSPPTSAPSPGALRELRTAERAHSTRALLYTDTHVAIGSKLGLVRVIRTEQEADVTSALGPDVLGPSWDVDLAISNVRRHNVPLAQALLDQTNLAGLGTFWVSEMLFIHKIHPWVGAPDVPRKALAIALEHTRTLMGASAITGIQSSTVPARSAALTAKAEYGAPRGPASLSLTQFVHARSGLSCLRCGAVVRVAMAGPLGRERTIFYCPACQGGLAPDDDGRPQGVLIERSRA